MLPAISATLGRAMGARIARVGDQPIKRPVFDLKSCVRFFWVRRLAAARKLGLRSSIVAESLLQSGFSIRAQIIWAKERLVMSQGDYHWQHEPCWYAVRKKGNWTGDRKQTTVWNISSSGQDAETKHSTQKPVECMRRPMLNNSSPGQAVYEPFLGSGTTLIAAQSCGRICLASEIDPLFVDVAIRRWQAFTGEKATREQDGAVFEVLEQETQSAGGARDPLV